MLVYRISKMSHLLHSIINSSRSCRGRAQSTYAQIARHATPAFAPGSKSVIEYMPLGAGSQKINVPTLSADQFIASEQPEHVATVNHHLRGAGLLKISLKFNDPECDYLRNLVLSLNKWHHHELPITHSADRGWFWDVKPCLKETKETQKKPQARSETSEDFPWHTDCSYESNPPRFFALQVLQHDTCGGGVTSALSLARLLSFISEKSRIQLCKPEFRIQVPPEFIKDENIPSIVGGILSRLPTNPLTTNEQQHIIRYRDDIIEPLTPGAALALQEIRSILSNRDAVKEGVINLTPEIMPKGSILLMDNSKWLHARSHVKDPNRHLRRIRWDARPF